MSKGTVFAKIIANPLTYVVILVLFVGAFVIFIAPSAQQGIPTTTAVPLSNASDPVAYCQSVGKTYSNLTKSCLNMDSSSNFVDKDAQCKSGAQAAGYDVARVYYDVTKGRCELTADYKADVCSVACTTYDASLDDCIDKSGTSWGGVSKCGTATAVLPTDQPTGGSGQFFTCEELGYVTVNGECVIPNPDVFVSGGTSGTTTGGYLPQVTEQGLVPSLTTDTLTFSNDWINPFNPQTQNPIIQFGQNLASSILNIPNTVFTAIANALQPIFSFSQNAVSNVLQLPTNLLNAATSTFNNVISTASSAINSGISTITNFTGNITTSATNLANTVVTTTTTAINNATNTVTNLTCSTFGLWC